MLTHIRTEFQNVVSITLLPFLLLLFVLSLRPRSICIYTIDCQTVIVGLFEMHIMCVVYVFKKKRKKGRIHNSYLHNRLNYYIFLSLVRVWCVNAYFVPIMDDIFMFLKTYNGNALKIKFCTFDRRRERRIATKEARKNSSEDTHRSIYSNEELFNQINIYSFHFILFRFRDTFGLYVCERSNRSKNCAVKT